MSRMKKLIGFLGLALAFASVSSVAAAKDDTEFFKAPEIDPGPAVSALTLAAGFAWVAMGRQRRR